MDDPLAYLQVLGFSLYEAKAYLALLQKHPVTGYELSRLSGIPSAKIYETLARLKARQAVTVILGEPLRYAPIPPQELLRGLRKDFETALTGLEEAFAHLPQIEPEYIWNIRQYSLLLEKTTELIKAAHREIAAFLWAAEAASLLGVFTHTAGRGVRLFGVLCGQMEGLPQFLRHGFEEVVLEEHQGRLLVLVRDGEEALLGGIGAENETTGVATRNAAVVRVALEYVKHELYQAKIMNRYGRRFIEDFGAHLERLRKEDGE